MSTGEHMRMTVVVKRDGEFSPLYYLTDGGNNEWKKASVRIMGQYHHFSLPIVIFVTGR